jgi:hypothetical protein
VIIIGRPSKYDYNNIIGKRFGNLVVISQSEDYITKDGTKRKQYLCKCDCGNKKIILGYSLFTNNTKSCGCLSSINTIHRNTKHGKSNTRLYSIYRGMKARCYYKSERSYKDYGGKGIIICKEWLNSDTGFINFYNWAIKNGYKNNLTIDRINNDINYSPDNCRWVDMNTQANNHTNNRLLTYKGDTKTIKQWSEITGLKYMTLMSRINRGWNIEKAITNKIKEVN